MILTKRKGLFLWVLLIRQAGRRQGRDFLSISEENPGHFFEDFRINFVQYIWGRIVGCLD